MADTNPDHKKSDDGKVRIVSPSREEHLTEEADWKLNRTFLYGEVKRILKKPRVAVAKSGDSSSAENSHILIAKENTNLDREYNRDNHEYWNALRDGFIVWWQKRHVDFLKAFRAKKLDGGQQLDHFRRCVLHEYLHQWVTEGYHQPTKEVITKEAIKMDAERRRAEMLLKDNFNEHIGYLNSASKIW
ncbi:MAG: hypothetical protein Q9224_006620 [Gallowayella concinna]